MKKAKVMFIYALFFLCFLLNATLVHALSEGADVTFNWESGDDVAADFGIKVGGNDYHVWNYYGSYEGKYMKLFCIDPTLLNDGHGDTIIASKIVDFNDSKTNLKERALYYGLYTILTDGGIPTRSTDKKELVAKDIAIRAYTNVIMQMALGNGNADSVMIAAKDAVINYGLDAALYNAPIVSYIMETCEYNNNSQIKECLKSKIGYRNSNNTFQFGEISSNISVRARELLNKGINQAYLYKLGGGVATEVSVNVESTNNIYDEATKLYDREEKIINFRIQGVQSGGYVKINRNNIKCEKCSENGISIESIQYYSANRRWVDISDDIDLTRLVDSKMIAKLKIVLKKTPSEKEDCDVNIKIGYRIFDPRYQYVLAFLSDNIGTPQTQRYFGVSEQSQNYYAGLSNAGNNESLQEKTVTTDIACINEPCDSSLASPVCEINESGYIYAPDNIKKCIINNTDEAGNTYKLLNSNHGVDNSYCSTFCKEDYQKIHFNDTIKNLNCGGYFKLKAQIEGSQDCYRSSAKSDKSINYEQFNNDMEMIQREFISEYNKYLGAQAANSKIDNGGAVVYNSDYNAEAYVFGDYSGYEVDHVNNDGTISIKPVTLSYNYYSSYYDENDSEYNLRHIKEDIKNDIDTAIKNLTPTTSTIDDTLYSRYMKIIENYNACTTSWDNTFNLSPKIGWDYKEYIDGKLQETYSKLLSDDQKYLISDKNTFKTNTQILACIGTTDNEYNLCNGNANNWQSIDSVFSNRTFKVCTVNGCSDDVKAISNATFVKQHIDATQEYTTPNVFYQIASSGPISGGVTTKGSYTGPNASLTPIDGLPLSLDAVGGGIFQMHLEDLGQFYDTGELGRLIDFKGDNESNSVAYKIGYNEINNWSGEYTCNFKTNCIPSTDIPNDPNNPNNPNNPNIPPINCPQCNFTCEGPFCEWQDCPECDIECVNCIYNKGELQLSMKSVSTAKFSSAEREYGYNWNITTEIASVTDQLELIKDKANAAVQEIEEANTTIYDDTNVDSKDSKLEFSITMTPNVTNYIRDYNKQVESQNVGGYSNQTLTCYDYAGADGAVYKNIFCYSSFIDDLVENYGEEVYTGKRESISNRTKEKLVNSEYWETWEKEHKKITSYNEQAIGGPSWK